ncbi:pyroglutamyl-peptidase I [Bacillus marinisedimentorum]|uniref:pyroglutamyl-peptidase I n=1 Tax=Bacillus marinisedimentorum TaxID=1821260 RepID=UPI0007DE678F|nr:pyroglutamyl-peptidase I [Bacillus marinisedimentorum]
MKKLLLTGFEPFLNHSLNPTETIAKKLDGSEIGDYRVFGQVLPVEYSRSAGELIDYYHELKPDVVISLGLAAGRNRITPERVAININDGVKDNRGRIPVDERIAEDGPDAYFSTLPIREFANGLQAKGLPAEISNTAGTYLCNNVMYEMLHEMNTSGADCYAGFIHLPASHELAMEDKSLPSWSQRDLLEAVRIMIEMLD